MYNTYPGLWYMFSLSPILSFKDGTLLCLRMSILDYVFLLEGKLASWCPGRHTTLIDHPSHEEAKNNRTQLNRKGKSIPAGFSSYHCKDLQSNCRLQWVDIRDISECSGRKMARWFMPCFKISGLYWFYIHKYDMKLCAKFAKFCHSVW